MYHGKEYRGHEIRSRTSVQGKVNSIMNVDGEQIVKERERERNKKQ